MPALLLPSDARMFSIVVAATHKGGIGKTGVLLPWTIPEVIAAITVILRMCDQCAYLHLERFFRHPH